MKPFPLLVFYVGSYLYSSRETHELWIANGIVYGTDYPYASYAEGFHDL